VTVEVGVRELRANLSAFLDRVKGGEDVVVTERGRAVARIVSPGEARSRIEQHIAEGRAHPPKAATRTTRMPTVRPKGGNVADLLIEMREQRHRDLLG
jgi:prevent-host-death family protein